MIEKEGEEKEKTKKRKRKRKRKRKGQIKRKRKRKRVLKFLPRVATSLNLPGVQARRRFYPLVLTSKIRLCTFFL